MNKLNRFFDWLELVSSVIFIGILVGVLWFSLKYWTHNIGNVFGLEARSFSTAMIITVSTVICLWIEGRIKSVIKVIQKIKTREGKHG